MRRQPCLVRIRVETLDEQYLVRGLIGQVTPLVFRIVPDIVRLALAFRKDQADQKVQN